MGVVFSSKKPPAKAPRVRKAVVNDYYLEHVPKRPKTSQSSKDARFIMMLCQQGRSATMPQLDRHENTEESNSTLDKPIPRWQSRWELDMRPDPRDISTTLKSKTLLRPWKSMQVIPTTGDKTNSTSNRSTPTNRTFNSRRGRRRRFSGRIRDTESARQNSVREIEDRLDRISVASMQIDGFKMLYKTDERTESTLDLSAQIWQFEQKKANKSWFLGDIHHTKQETHPNDIVMPRKVKPYTSIIKTIHRPPMLLQKHHETIREQPETIREED